jgi:hypothetical protein
MKWSQNGHNFLADFQTPGIGSATRTAVFLDRLPWTFNQDRDRRRIMIEIIPPAIAEEATTSQFLNLIKQRSDKLVVLVGYCIAFDYIIENYRTLDIGFPPSKSEVLDLLKNYDEQYDRELSKKKRKKKIDSDGPEKDESETLEDLLDNRVIIKRKLDNIKVKDEKSFYTLIECSVLMDRIYRFLIKILQNPEAIKLDQSNKYELLDQGHYLLSSIIFKFYELKGFWTAKMEQKRIGYQSTKTKSKKRQQNEETVGKLLKKYDNIVNRKFLIEAQEKIDRGERTVTDLIKKIQNK